MCWGIEMGLYTVINGHRYIETVGGHLLEMMVCWNRYTETVGGHLLEMTDMLE